jgi:hypothetical protein
MTARVVCFCPLFSLLSDFAPYLDGVEREERGTEANLKIEVVASSMY